MTEESPGGRQKRRAAGAGFSNPVRQSLDLWLLISNRWLLSYGCPANLRKLFARRFYAVKKDIAKLADVLGHSNINTTRIYLMTTGVEHRRTLDRLGLVS